MASEVGGNLGESAALEGEWREPSRLSNTADAFHKASTRNLWIDLAIQRSRDLARYSFRR